MNNKYYKTYTGIWFVVLEKASKSHLLYQIEPISRTLL